MNREIHVAANWCSPPSKDTTVNNRRDLMHKMAILFFGGAFLWRRTPVRRYAVLLTLLAVMVSLPLRLPAAELTRDQMDFFENKIRPVLADHCYKCHSTLAEKVKGDLLLDSRDALLKGGESGPVIVPGNPDASLLIQAIRYTNTDLQMPKDKKLADDEIADLEAWVKMGRRTRAPPPPTCGNSPTTRRTIGPGSR